MMNTITYDIIIIGGGPAGLSAAQYAARCGLKVVILDKSPDAGALAYAVSIENYPGLTNPIPGKELLNIFRRQAITFGAAYKESQVFGVKIDSEIKEVYTPDEALYGKSVIIAPGAMGRKPSLPGEKELLGRGVSYCAMCDAPFYKDKTVCVIGGSDEAIKEANALSHFARTVYLIDPGKRLRISPQEIKGENVRFLNGYMIKGIVGTNVVERIRIVDVETGEEKTLDTNGVFIYLHGSKPIVDFLGSSVEISENECIMVNRMMETSRSGVFAAGDVTCVDVRQIVTATANGCVAALSAEKYIRGRKRRKYDWSLK